MKKPLKLIEVAMPVKEISAESVRDKSIRHGHISTLHLWWARRPLPACRAVVFASIVPDPLDEHCPPAFREAVDLLLSKNGSLPGDPYRPYKDIPHTLIVDPMEDNLRHRLMMFIGKFSDRYVKNEKKGKSTPAKERISDFSLIKWENKNNEEILTIARQLIFVAHNADQDRPARDLLREYDRMQKNLKKAEKALYSYPNRHRDHPEVEQLKKARDEAQEAFLSRMPQVFDPFAGGGAIPLEAARLGCNSYGNDINPVAHIIQKGSVEFPQKYGKPIRFSREEYVRLYGEEALNRQRADGNLIGEEVHIPNRLAHDVEFYAEKLLERAEEKIGHLYPADSDGRRPIAYYWARVGTCANPTCGAEVPLLRQFYLSRKKNKYIHLHPIIDGKKIDFEIREGRTEIEGWMSRSGLNCPVCHNITDVATLKKESIKRSGKLKERLLAVVFEEDGKGYRLPNEDEISSRKKIEGKIRNELIPQEPMQKISDLVSGRGWGIDHWKDMFSDRQLFAMQTFVEELQAIKSTLEENGSDYHQAVITYLAIFIDRLSIINTSFGRLDVTRDNIQHPFSRQAIPMIFDYPESNPFSERTGSAKNQLDWILRYIHSESFQISAKVKNASSGEKNQFAQNELDVVVTDPPYYDAIAYADLSDFFYVWLKRTVADIYPLTFATPQTPKTEECTALKHHHENDAERAFHHFENKLLEIFDAIEYQTKDLVSIMFAHQSTKAWTTLCNSILGARMNITGSWAIDTEMQSRTLALVGDTLSTSVTVACRPSEKSGIGDYQEVRAEVLHLIKDEVKALYALGFRGADLLTACFGKAVSVFGKYESVEKRNGEEVTVAELLEMARQSAFNAIISDIDTDDVTRFYIGWLSLFGFSDAAHDDVRRITQIGLDVNIQEIYSQHILIRDRDKGILADMEKRIELDARLGGRKNDHDIDIAHRLMYLYGPGQASRKELLAYIKERAPEESASVWRVLNSLAELLPENGKMKDQSLAAGLLSNQENLLREAKNQQSGMMEQGSIDF